MTLIAWCPCKRRRRSAPDDMLNGRQETGAFQHPFYELIDAAHISHEECLRRSGKDKSCKDLEDPSQIRAAHPYILGPPGGQRLQISEDYKETLGEEKYQLLSIIDMTGKATYCPWNEESIFEDLFAYFSHHVSSFASENNSQPHRSKAIDPIRILQFPPQGYTQSTNSSMIDELFHYKAFFEPFDSRALDALLETGAISFLGLRQTISAGEETGETSPLQQQQQQRYPRNCFYHVLGDVSPGEFRRRVLEHIQASGARPKGERTYLHSSMQHLSAVAPAIEVFHLTVQCFELGLCHGEFNVFSTERATSWTMNLVEGSIEEDHDDEEEGEEQEGEEDEEEDNQ
eukprot:TRINITY_DN43690_c0_g1_i1.p1 TRINITY_DN43690_c0_g1~~TRINITY_DN43690_c0_g1_i1.p1  ORF type:complete len:344 (+),score=62.55 TRINITY_DN43690_c0_g1_i1:42-1073(+)